MTITLTIKYNKFYFKISGEGFNKNIGFIKTLSGREYDPDTKLWNAPISEINIEKIKKGKDLFWSIKELNNIGKVKSISNPIDIAIETVKKLQAFIKEVLPILRSYQIIDVAVYIYAYHILNANEMGLGKTIETGAYIFLMRVYKEEIEEILGHEINPANKILIVVPNSLKTQWKNELNDFFQLKAIIIDGIKTKRAKQWNALHAIDKKFIIITNYENLRTDDYTKFKINNIYFDLLVCDEITKCKNHSTSTFKRVYKIHAKKKVGLTGTPIENHLTDIYTIMKIINNEFFPPWNEFRRKNFREGRFGELITRPGATNRIAMDLPNFNGFIRWKRESVLEDLPELLLNIYKIKLTKEERKHYNKIDNEIANIRDKKDHRINLGNILSRMLALRRLCSDPAIYLTDKFKVDEYNSAKKKEFVRVIKDNINGRKILVFSQFKDVIKNYAKALKKQNIKLQVITGDTPQKLRDVLIKRFRDDKDAKVLLATDAFSYGQNLQFCSILVNIDMHWNPAIIKQRIGRIYRIGQKSNAVNVISFLVENTIESFVYSKILAKNKIFNIVITDNEKTAIMDMYKQYEAVTIVP